MGTRVSQTLARALATDALALSQPQALTWLHAIARDLAWVLGELHWDEYPKSFHWIAVSDRDRRFAILVGREAPVVALSEALPDYFNLRFFDDPRLGEAIERAGAPFECLAAAELNAPSSAADRDFVARISPQYGRDLAYWRPKTIGDVIFNWWD